MTMTDETMTDETMTDETMTELVEVTLRIKATAEEIFPFLLEEEKLALWLGQEVQADARAGGRLRVAGSTEDVLACEYLEIEPPRRLLMTWGWESGGAPDLPPGASRVEVTLVPVQEDTLVRVRHFGLPPALAATHEQGWIPGLRFLQEAAEGRPGAARCVGDPLHHCSGA